MQPSLFDIPQTATQARDLAIDAAEAHANAAWLDAARRAVREVARVRESFTSDDVMAVVKERTHELRAMGAVMTYAARERIAEPTPEYRTTGNIRNHNRPMRVWRSLIYKPQ